MCVIYTSGLHQSYWKTQGWWQSGHKSILKAVDVADAGDAADDAPLVVAVPDADAPDVAVPDADDDAATDADAADAAAAADDVVAAG